MPFCRVQVQRSSPSLEISTGTLAISGAYEMGSAVDSYHKLDKNLFLSEGYEPTVVLTKD